MDVERWGTRTQSWGEPVGRSKRNVQSILTVEGIVNGRNHGSVLNQYKEEGGQENQSK
jgi:hypothetical protein